VAVLLSRTVVAEKEYSPSRLDAALKVMEPAKPFTPVTVKVTGVAVPPGATESEVVAGVSVKLAATDVVMVNEVLPNEEA